MSDENSENYVLLYENTFYEKWQSGRINFFWGGFLAFMVYALTLISTGFVHLPRIFVLVRTKIRGKWTNSSLGYTKLI